MTAMLAAAAQGGAFAEAASGSAPPVDTGPACDPAGNQMQMNACAVRDYRAADAQLNLRYRALISSLANAQVARLRQQQRAWLRERDPSCKREAQSFEGGSAWPLMFYSCLQKATESRTEALNKMWLRKKSPDNGNTRS